MCQKNCFSIGKVAKFLGSISVETEEQSRGSTAVCKGGFGLKTAIQSLNYIIGLKMRSCVVDVGNLQEGGKGGGEM